jgi:rod shape determining protein RodA
MTPYIRILLIAILVASVGILSIYSGTYQKGSRLWQLQFVWIVLGLVAFIIVSNFNYRRFWDMTYFLYAIALFLLLLVLALGVVRLGAQRWLRLAWFNFQPSELAKLIIVIFFSRYFSRKSAEDISLLSLKFGIFRGLILPFIFVAIPIGLIIEQPDLGSALMIFFIFITMLYITNVRMKYIYIFLLIIILSLPVLWQTLRDYQKERLLVFLNPNIDPLGAGYTLIQSKIAIGAGGLFGKGWLVGTQSQLQFLPESHTDFIFATFAEEWGFLGSCTLLLLYYLLVREGLLISQRTTDHFGKLLALGISFLLGIQIVVNVAMTMGLVPVVGLPLPLMSYGGSSVITTFIALGILANINKTRSVF